MAGKPPPGRVGTCLDAYGDLIAVDVEGDAVYVTFADSDDLVQMKLGAPEREEFQRLFMEAERQAEASA